MFAANIEATLRRAGYDVTTVEDVAALEAAVRPAPPDLVIFDLHAGPAAAAVVSGAAGAPVLAFGRHTEPAALRAARPAGCAEVVVRSTFVAAMAALVEALATGRTDHGPAEAAR